MSIAIEEALSVAKGVLKGWKGGRWSRCRDIRLNRERARDGASLDQEIWVNQQQLNSTGNADVLESLCDSCVV